MDLRASHSSHDSCVYLPTENLPSFTKPPPSFFSKSSENLIVDLSQIQFGKMFSCCIVFKKVWMILLQNSSPYLWGLVHNIKERDRYEMPCKEMWGGGHTETDRMATVSNGIGVNVKYDHLHKILYKTFLSVLISVSVCVSVNTLQFESTGDRDIFRVKKTQYCGKSTLLG